MPNKRVVGFDAETYLSKYLKNQGFNYITRNFFVYGIGEIDLIMEKEETLFFYEIRSRTDKRLGAPSQSINPNKIYKIKRTAFLFIKLNKSYSSYMKKIIFASLFRTRYNCIIKFYEI